MKEIATVTEIENGYIVEVGGGTIHKVYVVQLRVDIENSIKADDLGNMIMGGISEVKQLRKEREEANGKGKSNEGK